MGSRSSSRRQESSSGKHELSSRLDVSQRYTSSITSNSSSSIPFPQIPPAPTSTPSLLRSNHDVKMASRQTRIESLPPSERAAQETWAHEQLKHLDGTCAAGYDWYRVKGGYRCEGGRHFVSDELLAEGKGGCYSRYAIFLWM
jgi:hypothetical protein